MEPGTKALLQFLHRSSHLFSQALEESAREWQISPSEAQILLFLALAPHMDTARDAAQYCGMSKASVSGNVLKLTTRGLLTVDMDLKDRRFQHLTPTEQAGPILEAILSRFRGFCAQLLSPLGPQEQEQLFRSLSRINSAADGKFRHQPGSDI